MNLKEQHNNVRYGKRKELWIFEGIVWILKLWQHSATLFVLSKEQLRAVTGSRDRIEFILKVIDYFPLWCSMLA